jgi:hypothetical protein
MRGLRLRSKTRSKIDAPPTTFSASATMQPNTFFRYWSDELRTTALVLKDLTILEVKRNGVSVKRHFKAYEEWLATLPAGAQVHVDAPPAQAPLPPPRSDAEWLLRGMGARGRGYHHEMPSLAEEYRKALEHKASTEKMVPPMADYWANHYAIRIPHLEEQLRQAGGIDSPAANKKSYMFKGQRPTYYIFGDGPVPQLLRVSSVTYPKQGPPTIFYKGRSGTSFAEVGLPVSPETGWPNLWRIAPGGEFMACPCPCPRM